MNKSLAEKTNMHIYVSNKFEQLKRFNALKVLFKVHA